MRLFIATPALINNYEKLQQELSPFIKGKWTKKENLHLTHKFIGEDNPKRWQIPLNIPNETIRVQGFGIFNKKILYLKAYSKHINTIAKELGVKNFTPHITLCRMKEFQAPLLEKLQNINFSQTIPFEVYLYQSILTPNGPIYKKIFKY